MFLNDWEGHRLHEEYYNQLVIKRISFIVINSFYSLFYIAFFDQRQEYTQDNTLRLEALRMQLVILFLMAIIYQNIMEIFCPVYCPKIVRKCNNCCSKKKHRRHVNKEQNEEYQELIASQTETELTEWNMSDVLKQSELSISPDVLDNTAEIVVLHGYVTLFIVVFPLMPLLAVINNFVELKVDKYNLLNTQRPVPTAAAGLGVWTKVLTVFAVVAIYSNLALLTFKTDVVTDFLKSTVGHSHAENETMIEDQITFFFVTSTLCLFVVIGIRMCIPPVSESTADDIARQEVCQRELTKISRKLRSEEIQK